MHRLGTVDGEHDDPDSSTRVAATLEAMTAPVVRVVEWRSRAGTGAARNELPVSACESRTDTPPRPATDEESTVDGRLAADRPRTLRNADRTLCRAFVGDDYDR